jgi:GNAT superfamily N-acetyltransferase
MDPFGPVATIRRVRPDEVETYRAFRLRALADAPDAFGDSLAAAEARPWSAWVERVAENAAGDVSVMVVAADPASGCWLGMTGCYFEAGEADVAEIVSVWVAPEARRQGLARQLLEAAGGWARSRGARALRLWVTETNEAARSLYLAAGFVPTGLVAPLPSNPALEELQMIRALSDASRVAAG